MSNPSQVSVELVPGNVAPRYKNRVELTCEKVVITEQGTERGLPIVDFVLEGPDGKSYLLVFSGRIVNMIASAVRGINARNHGVEDP